MTIIFCCSGNYPKGSSIKDFRSEGGKRGWLRCGQGESGALTACRDPQLYLALRLPVIA